MERFPRKSVNREKRKLQVSLELPLRCGEERVSLIEKANSGGRKKERQRGCRAQPEREREREREREDEKRIKN